jgi:hypothetical protein
VIKPDFCDKNSHKGIFIYFSVNYFYFVMSEAGMNESTAAVGGKEAVGEKMDEKRGLKQTAEKCLVGT